MSHIAKKLEGRTFYNFAASILPFCRKTPKQLNGVHLGWKKLSFPTIEENKHKWENEGWIADDTDANVHLKWR